jgi:hypothetical protein
MGCMITVSVVEESVTGNIGDDWKYSIAAKAIDPAGTSVECTAHGRPAVSAGVWNRKDRGARAHPEPGRFSAAAESCGCQDFRRPCGTRVRVELTLEATEVDWLVDDPALKKRPSRSIAPLGKTPVTVDTSISVTVREHPKLLGGEATFTVKLRLVATCV